MSGKRRKSPPVHQGSNIARMQQSVQQYSGPIPPPSMLEHYNNIYPQAAETIIKMAQEQSAHRQRMELKVISYQQAISFRGQWFALIIAVICVTGVCFCAYIQQPWPASVLGGATIIGSITAFVRGKRKQEDELRNH